MKKHSIEMVIQKSFMCSHWRKEILAPKTMLSLVHQYVNQSQSWYLISASGRMKRFLNCNDNDAPNVRPRGLEKSFVHFVGGDARRYSAAKIVKAPPIVSVHWCILSEGGLYPSRTTISFKLAITNVLENPFARGNFTSLLTPTHLSLQGFSTIFSCDSNINIQCL